jgi:putative FmdB family regulatory protein
MPTYGYACEQCGHEFDSFQSITAKPLRKCPQCGRSSLKRLIGTGAGILFKGSGFYCTDYRGDSYKKAAGGESGGAASKVADKTETKTESASTAAVNKTEASPSEKRKSA